METLAIILITFIGIALGTLLGNAVCLMIKSKPRPIDKIHTFTVGKTTYDWDFN